MPFEFCIDKIKLMIYFFYGEEDFNIDEEIARMKSELDPNFLEMSYKYYSAADKLSFPDLISVLRTQPMMFGKILIVIDFYDYLTKTLDDKEIEQIAQAFENNTQDTDVVLVAKFPRDDDRKKPDARKKLFKLLMKQNAKEFASIPVYKQELNQWIKIRAKKYEIELDNNAVEVVISMLGNNLRQIDSELQKLSVSIYPNKKASAKDVEEFCTSNEDLFTLSDALMKMDLPTAFAEYKKLLNKNHPLKILATLQTMLRKWIIIKSQSQKLNSFELMKLTGMKEYPIQLAQGKLKDTSLKELIKLKSNLTDCEYRIKNGQALDIEREVADAFIIR